MTEQFGSSQVKEVRITRAEITAIMLENLKARGDTSYDFDYDRPWISWDAQGNLVFRFIQHDFTEEKGSNRREVWWPSMADLLRAQAAKRKG